jgi:hypothetical protein
VKLPFGFDEVEYLNRVRAVGALSRLFSDNEVPYLDSRVVERLFLGSVSGRDMSREDKSIDVLVGEKWGVGVKTFIGTGKSKIEKIAEFNRASGRGTFAGKNPEQIATAVSAQRNIRLESDLNELGIDISDCLYHCLVRRRHQVFIHHECMHLIDLDGIRPLGGTKRGRARWDGSSPTVRFTDGKAEYSFNRSKSVLSKRFKFESKVKKFQIEVLEDPLPRIVHWASKELGYSIGVPPSGEQLQLRSCSPDRSPDGETMRSLAGVNYVILPLYSTRSREVEARSGINQWAAGGRLRKFGEAYVPVPASIHSLFPRFFPARDTKFLLQLPIGEVSAKICQDSGKALMSDPNHLLGEWLIGVLDPTIPKSAFNRVAPRRAPFKFSDLERIGKDSIRIEKLVAGRSVRYVATFAPLGSYEEFIEQFA